MTIQEGISHLGKGPGFFLFAFLCAGALFALVYIGKDVSGLTGPLGAVCAGLYGGGGLKAWAESKNGSSPSSHSSSP